MRDWTMTWSVCLVVGMGLVACSSPPPPELPPPADARAAEPAPVREAPVAPPPTASLTEVLADLVGGETRCQALDLVDAPYGVCGPERPTESAQCKRREAAVIQSEVALAKNVTAAVVAVGCQSGIPSFEADYAFSIGRDGTRGLFRAGLMAKHPAAGAEQSEVQFEPPVLIDAGDTRWIEWRSTGTRVREFGDDSMTGPDGSFCNGYGLQTVEERRVSWCTTGAEPSCHMLRLSMSSTGELELDCDGPVPPWARTQADELAKEESRFDYQLEMQRDGDNVTIRTISGSPPDAAPVGRFGWSALIARLPALSPLR